MDKKHFHKAYRAGYEVAWSTCIRHIKECMKETNDINVILKSLEKCHDCYPCAIPLEKVLEKLDDILPNFI